MAAASIRRKLAALASLCDYLCECNAVTHNPVRGVKRPKAETSESKTPALGDVQSFRLQSGVELTNARGRIDQHVKEGFSCPGDRSANLGIERLQSSSTICLASQSGSP